MQHTLRVLILILIASVAVPSAASTFVASTCNEYTGPAGSQDVRRACDGGTSINQQCSFAAENLPREVSKTFQVLCRTVGSECKHTLADVDREVSSLCYAGDENLQTSSEGYYVVMDDQCVSVWQESNGQEGLQQWGNDNYDADTLVYMGCRVPIA